MDTIVPGSCGERSAPRPAVLTSVRVAPPGLRHRRHSVGRRRRHCLVWSRRRPRRDGPPWGARL